MDERRTVCARNYLTGRLTYGPARPVAREAKPEVVARALSEVGPREVEWVWRPFLPAGKLAVLCGDPGVGKSFLTLAIAAAISRGAAMPPMSDVGCRMSDVQTRHPAPSSHPTSDIPHPTSAPEPGDVVLLSAEDDAADTIRPRLIAMGGDPARVHVVEGVGHCGLGNADCGLEGRDTAANDGSQSAIRNPKSAIGSEPFSIGEHVPLLERVLGRLKRPRLVVIDPVSAFVGPSESYNNAQVRALLRPLTEMASSRGVAVLLVTHLRKGRAMGGGGGAGPGAGERTVYRAMGSLAIPAAARVVLSLTRDPQDPERRLLLPVKSNVGCDGTGLALRVVEGRVEFEPEPLVGVGDVVAGVTGGVPVPLPAPLPTALAYAPERVASGRQRERESADRARNLLRALLRDGPVLLSRIAAELKEAGLSIKLARRSYVGGRLGVRSRRTETGWVWELPEAPSEPGRSRPGSDGRG